MTLLNSINYYEFRKSETSCRIFLRNSAEFPNSTLLHALVFLVEENSNPGVIEGLKILSDWGWEQRDEDSDEGNEWDREIVNHLIQTGRKAHLKLGVNKGVDGFLVRVVLEEVVGVYLQFKSLSSEEAQMLINEGRNLKEKYEDWNSKLSDEADKILKVKDEQLRYLD